jgi:hypothetical protein
MTNRELILRGDIFFANPKLSVFAGFPWQKGVISWAAVSEMTPFRR